MDPAEIRDELKTLNTALAALSTISGNFAVALARVEGKLDGHQQAFSSLEKKLYNGGSGDIPQIKTRMGQFGEELMTWKLRQARAEGVKQVFMVLGGSSGFITAMLYFWTVLHGVPVKP